MAMTIIKPGYHCDQCGEVEGRIWWSNKEQDLVVSCTKCGAIIQTHDQAMYYSSLKKEDNKHDQEQLELNLKQLEVSIDDRFELWLSGWEKKK